MSPDLLQGVGRCRDIAQMFRRAHEYAVLRAMPERIVIVGDTVETTWAPWMDAQLRDCERIHSAWLTIMHALAVFDDNGLALAIRAFDDAMRTVLPPVYRWPPPRAPASARRWSGRRGGHGRPSATS